MVITRKSTGKDLDFPETGGKLGLPVFRRTPQTGRPGIQNRKAGCKPNIARFLCDFHCFAGYIMLYPHVFLDSLGSSVVNIHEPPASWRAFCPVSAPGQTKNVRELH